MQIRRLTPSICCDWKKIASSILSHYCLHYQSFEILSRSPRPCKYTVTQYINTYRAILLELHLVLARTARIVRDGRFGEGRRAVLLGSTLRVFLLLPMIDRPFSVTFVFLGRGPNSFGRVAPYTYKRGVSEITHRFYFSANVIGEGVE
jgi:hypothetical protein